MCIKKLILEKKIPLDKASRKTAQEHKLRCQCQDPAIFFSEYSIEWSLKPCLVDSPKRLHKERKRITLKLNKRQVLSQVPSSEYIACTLICCLQKCTLNLSYFITIQKVGRKKRVTTQPRNIKLLRNTGINQKQS